MIFCRCSLIWEWFLCRSVAAAGVCCVQTRCCCRRRWPAPCASHWPVWWETEIGDKNSSRKWSPLTINFGLYACLSSSSFLAALVSPMHSDEAVCFGSSHGTLWATYVYNVILCQAGRGHSLHATRWPLSVVNAMTELYRTLVFTVIATSHRLRGLQWSLCVELRNQSRIIFTRNQGQVSTTGPGLKPSQAPRAIFMNSFVLSVSRFPLHLNICISKCL